MKTIANEPATGFFSGDLNHDMPGLTKRELFAAMALQGLLANPDRDLMDYSNFAANARQHADDLIDALNAKD